jgi:hypothetical protein
LTLRSQDMLDIVVAFRDRFCPWIQRGKRLIRAWVAGRAPVPGGHGGAGRVAGERGRGPVRGLAAVGLLVAGPVCGGRDRRAARCLAASADLAVAAPGRDRGAGMRAAPDPSPVGCAADRVQGRPARCGRSPVTGDRAPGAVAQRDGGPAGPAAQAQVQAVATGDADGAVAAGPSSAGSTWPTGASASCCPGSTITPGSWSARRCSPSRRGGRSPTHSPPP